MITKIRVDFDATPELDGGSGMVQEYLWADQLPGGKLTVVNVPLYCKGLAYEDVVEIGEGNVLTSIFVPSGNQTVRIALSETYMDSAEWEYPVITALNEAGCETAVIVHGAFAVSVPIEVGEKGLQDVLAQFPGCYTELEWA